MNEIIHILNQFSFSDILLICGGLTATVLFIEKFFKWILEKLNLFHKKKSNEEELLKAIKVHGEQINKICTQLNKFDKILEGDKEVTKRMLRQIITKSCEEYLKRGSIETYELQALEDLFYAYETVLRGNSFVHMLIKKVRILPVINKYDSTCE